MATKRGLTVYSHPGYVTYRGHNLSSRLLGPGAAADVLQLTNNLSGASQARFHLVTSDDIRVMGRNDEDPFDDLFQVLQYSGELLQWQWG